MKVTAKLFNPPGRGEYMERTLDTSDSEMPNDAFSAGERSVRAMRHFFPTSPPKFFPLPIGRALVAVVEEGRTVVRGSHWEVEWATDEYLREATEFFHRFVAGNATNEEFIERCEARPAAMVCDLTINQKQGVPA